MRFTSKDCFDSGFLKKIPPSEKMSKESIENSKIWMEEAKKGLKSEACRSVIISSYLVMFHIARAILFLVLLLYD